MRKLLAAVFAVLFCAVLAVPAMADGDSGGPDSSDPCVRFGPDSEDCRNQGDPPDEPEPCAEGFERREDGNCYRQEEDCPDGFIWSDAGFCIEDRPHDDPPAPEPETPTYDPNPASPCGSDTGPKSAHALIFEGETVRGLEVEPFAWQRCAGTPSGGDLVTIKPTQCNRVTGVIRATRCKANGYRHIQWHPNELGSYQELRVLNPATGQENTYRKLEGRSAVERWDAELATWVRLHLGNLDHMAFSCGEQ